MTSPSSPIVVTAAVVRRGDAYLVTRRLGGTHLAGCWEFPGGKCNSGEPLEACLAREIEEELGVDVRIGPKIFQTVHHYPERSVELHFFACDLGGDPKPLIGQDMQWVERTALGTLEFPEADAALIARLQAGDAEPG